MGRAEERSMPQRAAAILVLALLAGSCRCSLAQPDLCPIGTYSTTGSAVAGLEYCGSTPGEGACACNQSSYQDSSNFPCTAGVDNNITDHILTAVESERWWRIDLGGSKYVYNVTLWPRLDEFYLEDSNTSIYIGSVSSDPFSNALCWNLGEFKSDTASLSITCYLQGQYLFAYKASANGTMNWAEIAIAGCDVCPADKNRTASAGSTSVNDCGKFLSCPAGYFSLFAGCQACSEGKYKGEGYGGCYNCSEAIACSAGEYFSPCDGTRDGGCIHCSNLTLSDCAPGNYLSPCGGTQDAACLACSNETLQCPAGEYFSACNGERDSGCIACSNVTLECPAGEYFSACNAVRDGTCLPCNITVLDCSIGEYFSACDGTRDGACIPCSNKLEGENTKYTSPGIPFDENNCAWDCVSGYLLRMDDTCQPYCDLHP
ncbi:hypothetical protein GUITHDRAFT_104300 [Guillardia theta CCMP2712]|uniref:TNFR-Cys domain-containing protein n=1 Tax=Guillardia theta (strain CCMP2712) TaxID=905079 RepID=L1JPB4_GUITC|nr:hypothetical protein GUITHDRAFT_104300 [Guillardia theta CCMP2712]EKX49903.1 hypothetical protein GUITHDRAFT_104300 [Guillardia theta CCMP2712]|eukprot:XP_005836883.1 hypothetical protein GUITHDRAFT_104300 [Guillardia theta CCMP2712]